MTEEGLHMLGKPKQKVLGDVTNTVIKRNHPLLPGKFLIGNDMIWKNDTSTAAIESDDPNPRKKRIIGELVNINKGKQKVNWSSGDANFPSFSKSTLLDADFEVSRRASPVPEHEQYKDEGDKCSSRALSSAEMHNISSVQNPSTTEIMSLKDKSIPEDENKLNILQPCTDIPGKNCSCSFCLKARSLWADLLYDDQKGRLLEVNKSRRGAKTLAGSDFCNEIGKGVRAKDEKYTKSEQDLMQLWKTLFVHIESLLTCESAQLQSSLLKLKELRDRCMRDAKATTDHQD